MLSSIGVTHLRYHQWANGRVLEETVPLPSEQLVKTLNGSFGSVYGALVHMYQADCIWWDRLNGRPPRQLADYEAPGCNYDLQKVWTEMLTELVTWAEGLADKDWLREVSYRTMAGTPYVTPLWQIVLHVVNHGSHHRGQITNMLRQLGIKPANLDLIGFYRSMAVFDQKSTFSAN